MTREEAHTLLEIMAINLTGAIANNEKPVTEQTKLMAKQIEAIDMAIEALQDRPQGEWIEEDEYGDLWVCDQCGFANEYKINFCHNCGARMSKGGDDE